jgi:NADH:ubiquinone oxidoreductase subunit E
MKPLAVSTAEAPENLASDLKDLFDATPRHPRFLLPLLQDIQSRCRYLPRAALKLAAEHLGIPESRVYAVATFYKALSLTPRGEKTVKVCLGTACHLRGAASVLDALSKALGISPGGTTEDLRFTLETVNCLGACALAPVVTVNDRVYGQMTPGRVAELVEKENPHEAG